MRDLLVHKRVDLHLARTASEHTPQPERDTRTTDRVLELPRSVDKGFKRLSVLDARVRCAERRPAHVAGRTLTRDAGTTAQKDVVEQVFTAPARTASGSVAGRRLGLYPSDRRQWPQGI
jgi:hypothetical protein